MAEDAGCRTDGVGRAAPDRRARLTLGIVCLALSAVIALAVRETYPDVPLWMVVTSSLALGVFMTAGVTVVVDVARKLTGREPVLKAYDTEQGWEPPRWERWLANISGLIVTMLGLDLFDHLRHAYNVPLWIAFGVAVGVGASWQILLTYVADGVVSLIRRARSHALRDQVDRRSRRLPFTPGPPPGAD
jgi:hypothetical protein